MPLLLLCESPLLSVAVASMLMGAPLHGDIDKVENSDNDSLFNATDDHRSRASVQIASSECKTTDHERVWRLPSPLGAGQHERVLRCSVLDHGSFLWTVWLMDCLVR